MAAISASLLLRNSALIADQDRRTLADALVNVSGVVPTKPEESALIQPLVHGFPAEIYLDGMPAFSFNALADPTSLTGVERIEFRVINIAAAGDTVLTERVDVFVLPKGWSGRWDITETVRKLYVIAT